MDIKKHLDQIEKCARDATPGPWRVGYNDGSGRYSHGGYCMTTGDDYMYHTSGCCGTEQDAKHIAQMNPQETLKLVDIVRELVGACEVYRSFDDLRSIVAKEALERAQKILEGDDGKL